MAFDGYLAEATLPSAGLERRTPANQVDALPILLPGTVDGHDIVVNTRDNNQQS